MESTVCRHQGKKRAALACLVAGIAVAFNTASAELIVYEGFNYDRHQWTDDGVIAEGIGGLNGGIGWPAPWEETASPLNGIAAEPRDVTGDYAGARTKALSYTDSRGNRLLTQPGQARLVNNAFSIRPLPRNLNTPGESVWVSFLAQGQGDNATGFGFLGLNHNGSGTYRIRLGKINGTSANWGIQVRNDVTVIATGPATSEAVMYLLRMDFPENTSEQIQLSLWFNPDLESEAELGEPDIATATNNTEFNYVLLRGRVLLDIDELRIGTTFASVTPHGPFQEYLGISRAVRVQFETEAEKEYAIQQSSDGENWETILTHVGDGQPFETGLQLDPSQVQVRVIVTSEPWTPNPSADPILPITDGLALHMDASAADTLTLDGIRVTEWRDAQGNDIVFTPMVLATDARPYFWASGPNGRPSLIFDLSALNTTSTAALNLMNDIEGATCFAVVQNQQQGAQNILRLSGSAGSIRFVQYRTGGRNAVQVRRMESDAAVTLYGGDRVNNVWGIDSSVSDFLNGHYTLYRDGYEVERVLSESTGRSEAIGSAVVRIGANTTDDLRNNWEGDIAEILFYQRALSREERNEVGKYLADKYDLPYYLQLEQEVAFDMPTNQVTLTFAAEGGTDYQIEATDDLTGDWQSVGSVISGLGFGERVFVTFDESAARGFYRLRKL